jgi:HK97 family phage major capsid protein
MSLRIIRERKAGKVGEMRALLAKAEGENRQLSAEEATRFDGLKSEVEQLEQQEARQTFLEEAERRQAGAVIAGDRADSQFEQLEKRVSLLKVLQAGMNSRALDGVEAEVHQEIERRTGRKANGFFVPMAALERRVSTTTSAGDLVGTDHRADQYIPALRNALLARRLGVRVLSGLRGNVVIPKYGTSLTTGWVAENSALTPSDMTFDDVSLTPKHAGSLTELSRQLIQQSDPSIEQLVRDDMAFGIAKAIDSALLNGGGSDEPDGITATLGTANATLATPSWAEVLRIVADVQEANAEGSHAWVMNPGVAAKLKSTLKVTSDAGAGFLLEGGRMADFPAYLTNQLAASTATNSVLFGDFSQILLGIWSELDILPNAYAETAYTKGNIMVRAMATVDVAIRHEEAFQWADDADSI